MNKSCPKCGSDMEQEQDDNNVWYWVCPGNFAEPKTCSHSEIADYEPPEYSPEPEEFIN